MYIPASNAEDRPDVMHAFIEAHPLAAVVTAGTNGLFATHIPLVLDRARGPFGTLEGHIARANPHHRQTLTSSDALVIFGGADAYITPSWYAAKMDHGKVVPTWNYIAVHVTGPVRFRDDREFLHRHLTALTQRHESSREHPWSIDDAPADYIAGLERAIVGFELTISRLEGKWKMSQNRSSADIDGVVHGLAMSERPTDREAAAIVDAVRPIRGA